ncbi:MAG: alpha/beta hydrolase family esterase [Panacagrimonas sp.]
MDPYANMQAVWITQVHAGRTRRTLVLKPIQARYERPPAIVLLHYRGGTGAEMANLTEVGTLVRDMGLWIFLPEAINGAWQHSVGQPPAQDPDVGFIDALIGNSITTYRLDSERIYLGGYSLGGHMALRFACERANRIAGAFVVGATFINALSQSCAPSRPVPFTFIHGTSDRAVSYNATRGVLSAPQTAARWAALNGCTLTVPEVQLPDLVNDGTRVRLQNYRVCSRQASVDFFTIEGGGHTWPGASTSPRSLGAVSYELHATLTMLLFFIQFPVVGL